MEPEIPVISTPPSQPTIPSVSPVFPKKNNLVAILLSVLLLITLLISGYLFLQVQKLSKQLAQLQVQVQATPIPSPAEVSSPTPDPTANWKTYTNDEFKFSLKYPNSWDIKMLGSNNSKTLIIAPQDIIAKLPDGGFGGGSFLTLSINFYDQPQSIPKSDKSWLIGQVSSTTIDYKPAQRYTAQVLQDFPGFAKGDLVDTVIVKNNDLYFKIDFMKKEYKTIFNQILSTFKFME